MLKSISSSLVQLITRNLPTTVATLAAVLLLGTSFLPPAIADEGMWTFDNFPKKTVKDKYGFEVTDEWLTKLRLASVRLAGGCSASFVSGDGLVMTNAHCAIRCVQQVSTEKNNYTSKGFYARQRSDELACPNVELNQLVDVKDVTAQINEATKGLEDQAYNKAQKAEMSRIEKECAGDATKFRCDVTTLYHGGLYHLYKYRVYRDVRLVFSPEDSIAFFGGDPDNFNFPRFDLDVAFLRGYEDGKPAKTPDHLAWSEAGPKEGDLVFMSGNPGRTDRLLAVSELETMRDAQMPRALIRMSERRGMLNEFAKIGPEEKRISEDTIMFLENSFKAQFWEYQTLLDKEFFTTKTKAENETRERIAADPKKQEQYGTAWDAIAKAQEVRRRMNVRYSMVETGAGFSSELFGIARTLVRGATERPKPNAERFREFRDSALPSLEQRLFSKAPIYPELEELNLAWSLTKLREDLGTDDPLVKKVLGKESPDSLAKSLVAGTKLADVDVRKKLWEGGQKAIDESQDTMIKLALLVDPDARALRKTYEDEVEAVEKKNSELIAKALFEERKTSVYPDATFTLRLTYGTVKGWNENGTMVAPFTKFAGLYDRATGEEPYALPKSWLDAKPRIKLETPMNFTTDNDIIGGNSGSPVVNTGGEIVGIAFDGNIHSLGGAFWFDDRINRAVAVHSSAILEALKTVYGADPLVKELKPNR
jgi:hypothetical protein